MAASVRAACSRSVRTGEEEGEIPVEIGKIEFYCPCESSCQDTKRKAQDRVNQNIEQSIDKVRRRQKRRLSVSRQTKNASGVQRRNRQDHTAVGRYPGGPVGLSPLPLDHGTL